jgi:tetratricopeptide (TPR) repeat protein
LRDPNKPYNWREEIVKLNPKNVEVYLLAAAECRSKHNFEGAVEYCNEILEEDDKNTDAYVLKGLCYRNMRENRKAVDNFRKAIELDKANIPSLQELSWLLSTQREDELRDGKYALKLARRSCELTKWENPLCLRSLAAAYAEIGDFSSAVKYQIESIEKGSSADSSEKILDFYKSGKPYRE